MKYQVMRIEEDLDFGCEERGADEPVMAVVVLKDENGTESRIRQEDQMLYDWNIEEGDTVILNENRRIAQKYSPGDWTQNCNSKKCRYDKIRQHDAGCQSRKTDRLDLPVLRRKSRTTGAGRRKNRDRMHIVRYADSNRKLNDFGL